MNSITKWFKKQKISRSDAIPGPGALSIGDMFSQMYTFSGSDKQEITYTIIIGDYFHHYQRDTNRRLIRTCSCAPRFDSRYPCSTGALSNTYNHSTNLIYIGNIDNPALMDSFSFTDIIMLGSFIEYCKTRIDEEREQSNE